jgi:hypothetical protein
MAMAERSRSSSSAVQSINQSKQVPVLLPSAGHSIFIHKKKVCVLVLMQKLYLGSSSMSGKGYKNGT